MDRKYGIAFATSKVQEEYRRLQDHSCTNCPSRRLPETTFRDLQDHMRKDHEMFFCELCIEHLQVFTHERKCYSRRDLAVHKRKGDPDDTSYRGHPLCEFCDQRYFDSDELLKHLRRQHYFCHFCETDGASNQYYNEYEDLKYHFKEEHFLCEEDQCHAEKFTHAFRSEIDLKAHKATAHSKNMTRAQVRQARQVDVDFSFPPRPRDTRDTRGLGGSGRGRGRGRYDRNDYDDTSRAVEASIMSASREVHVREEEARHEKRTKPRDKKAPPTSSTEVRRTGSNRQDVNGGKKSPVSWDSNKENTAAATAAAKTAKMTSKGPDKENRQKGVAMSLNISEKSKSAAEASAMNKPPAKDRVSEKKKAPPTPVPADVVQEKLKVETQEKKGHEKKVIEDFPSLATFKPLCDETVAPSWNQEEKRPPATVAPPSLNKGGGKKKKKKKDETQSMQPAVVEQTVQPIWPKSGKSIAPSAQPSRVASSMYQKQPSTPYQKQPSTPQPAAGTWLPNKKSNPGSSSSSKSAWANNSIGAPKLSPNAGDFPTLSSIADLLGGTSVTSTTSSSSSIKATKDSATSSQKGKKSLRAVEGDFTVATKSGKSQKKENKLQKSVRATTTKAVTNGNGVDAQPSVIKAATKSPDVPLAGPRKTASAVASTHRPPPGIGPTPAPVSNVVNRAPPPGFNPVPKKHHPPPGFGGAPVTNQNYALTDYVQPSDYQARNLTLLGKIKDYLSHDDGKLMIFKTVSGDFRRSLISPAEYYQHCQDLLGDNLPKIFTEMVSLLPDVVKQQQLLEAHHDYKVAQTQKTQEKRVLAISEHKTNSGGGRKTGGKAWSSSAEHSTCTQCGQVMLKSDMDRHLNSHQDFPSLTASVGGKSKTIIGQPSWGAKIK